MPPFEREHIEFDFNSHFDVDEKYHYCDGLITVISSKQLYEDRIPCDVSGTIFETNIEVIKLIASIAVEAYKSGYENGYDTGWG